jgi:hypothetical protein
MRSSAGCATNTSEPEFSGTHRRTTRSRDFRKAEMVMGELMIRCPKTGKLVSTGIHMDRARLRSVLVFFSSCTAHRAASHTSVSPAMRGCASQRPKRLI